MYEVNVTVGSQVRTKRSTQCEHHAEFFNP